MDKQTLRRKYLEIRKSISNKELKSNIIFNKIINTKEYRDAHTIAMYKSLKSEVNTDKLIDYAIANNKVVLIPKVEKDNLVFYKIDKQTKLIKSNFGVLEPVNSQIITKENIDLIIVPGVCFDQKGNRLGFGKGYYDRFLNDMKTIKIGICYKEQLSDNIPTNNNDIKMDLIITD